MTTPDEHYEQHGNTGLSAHWGPKYGRQMLHNVVRNHDGSITGIAIGHDNGFTSSPDRVVTIPAKLVKERRIRFLTK